MLTTVKEQLRAIPRRGIGYGLLRYLRGDEALTSALAALPRAEILFNYLGQVGQAVPEAAPLRGARESAGAAHSARARRTHLLEVNSSIAGGRLQLSFTYGSAVHERAQISALAEGFLGALRGLIEHCLSPEAGGYTASDFHAGKLGQQVVDRLTQLSNLPVDVEHSTLASRKNIEDVYPLSPLQEGLLFHSLYAEGEGAYVSQLDWAVRGSFDVRAFERAFQRLIDHHGSLRTFFVWEGIPRPVQVVCKQATLTLDFRDLRALPPEARMERLRAFANDSHRREFDLSRAPLLRITVFQLGDELHRCVFDIHHLLIDGWSMPILMRELRALYEAHVAGRELTFEPTTPYGEFIAELEKKDPARAEAYFRGLLRGFASPTPFGVDTAPREGGPSGHEEQLLAFSAAESDEIAAFARAEGLTLNTVLQGAFALLLSRYSGEEDVLFGATVSGRSTPIPGIERMVGLFINALPVRVSLPPDERVSTFLSTLQIQQSEIREFEHTPLVTVQGFSDVPRGTPLFETLIVFENFPIEEVMDTEPVKEASDTLAKAPAKETARRSTSMGDTRVQERSNYPLTIVAAYRTLLTLKLDFDRARFAPETIRRMVGHLRILLEGIIRAPSARLRALPLLDETERRTLLLDWNQTATAYPREASVAALFEAQVDRTPESIALRFGDTTLTYRELDRQANQLAHLLRARGVGPQVPIGLHAERSPSMIIAVLAILKAGGAYVPLDPEYPPARLRWMIDDASLPLIVSQGPLPEALAFPEGALLRLDQVSELLARQDQARLEPGQGGDQLAYVMYTSGSTGKPKGVCVPHRAVVRLVEQTNYAHFGEDEVFLQLAPLAFDASTFEIWGPLLNGGRLGIFPPERPSPETIGAAVRDHGVTTLWLTTGLFNAMIDANAPGLASLRQLLFGGEVASVPHVQKALGLLPGVQIINCYGPTEGTTFSTYHPVRVEDVEGAIPIGRPIANTVVYVLDPAGAPVPIGVKGELFIGGDGLALGYLNRPELTAERFVADAFSSLPGARLYRTGDLVRYRASGALEFLGRIDQQVKIRGHRIEPGEIEAVLQQHEGVREALVFPREYGPGDKRLVAYLVPEQIPGPGVDELRAFLRAQMPEYMVPSSFVKMEAFPLTPNGKIDRRALPDPEVGAAVEDTFVAPRGPVEDMLVGIFAEVLKLPAESIGIQSGFFDLGGHSLLATQAISRIRGAFGVELPLRALFEAPTPAALGQRVEEAIRGAAGLALPPLERHEGSAFRPLSFAQERLWFLDQLTPGDSSYNIHLAMQIAGSLDTDALRKALSELVRRHEALR
ncbi:MAG: amino acid adenylation domain-containing protein, partial [Minicystis sp.]